MQYIQLQSQDPNTLPLPTGSFNIFVDQTDNYLKIKDSAGKVYGSNIGYYEVTYSGLVDTITTSGLSAGSFYLITDFRTCYDQPDFNLFGSAITTGNYKQAAIQPIIVFATSESTISIDAYQPMYPKDKIKYDYTYSATEVTNNVAYGRITERIDEFNNRTDYDHRTILFKRYDNYYYGENNIATGTIELIQNTGEVIGTETVFSDYSIGDYIAIPNANVTFFEIVSISGDTSMVVSGLTIPAVSAGASFYSAQKSALTYKQNNISIESTEHPTFLFETETIISNYIGDVAIFRNWDENDFLLSNNVFGEDVIGNRIGNNFMNNTFSRDVEHNVIGDDFENNTIDNDSDFIENQIGTNFRNNLIICNGFNDNVISDGFRENKIFNYNDFVDNQIGNEFDNNTIYGTFNNNSIGNQFNNNDINGVFDNNSIGNQFNNNDIYQDFNDNLLGNYFNNNTIYSDFYDNEILNNFYDNIIGDSGNLDNFEFYRNRIGNNFEQNIIRQDFQNNQIGNQFNENVVNGDFYKNIIGNGFYFNKNIGYRFYGNKIGNGFNENDVIGDYFQDNQIGEYFNSNNNISYNFKNNQIGNQFENNTLGNTDYFNWDNTTIENLTGRTYDTFYGSLYGYEGNYVDNIILGKELIMHDTVNDEYHKVKFTQWTQDGNGGGFSYERTKVYPTVESTVVFTKTNYGNEVDVIVEGFIEITRGDNGAIYNVADEGNWDSNQSPVGTEWNSIYTQENINNGSGFQDNIIDNEFKGNLILNFFAGNYVKSYVGGNEFSGNVYSNQIGSFTYDNQFLGEIVDNTWQDNFYVNVIGDSFYKNTFETNIGNNTIANNFQSNQILNNFEDNTIGQDFYSNNIKEYFYENTIGDGFQTNQIGSYFNNNTIDSYFGYGYGAPQGNKIGSNFYNNTVGEYFYNNTIPDNFTENTIGEYFQWNVVNTNIDTTDFTVNLGNITGFTYIATGTTASDDIYTGLTGTTNGIGVNATFDIEVSSSAVIGVSGNTEGKLYLTGDTITILGTEIGGYSNAIDTISDDGVGKNGSDGTYNDLSVTGGTGTNATFDVSVNSGLVDSVIINNRGNGYEINDELTIIGSLFGGTDGVDDITITVTALFDDDIVITVSGVTKPSVYEHYTCQIFERQGGAKRLSFYDGNDILTIKNINE